MTEIAKASAKIRELKVRAVVVPMEPHRTASGVVSESPLVLMDVVTDASVGHSITFTYTRAALKPVAEFAANVAPLIAGRDLAPAAITDELAKRFRLLGTEGLVGMAIAGIDMAMWDALARMHSMSLVNLLGFAPKPVPAYGGVGYDGTQGSVRATERWIKHGLKGVKLKIGYPTVNEDCEVVRAARSSMPREAVLMVDYNQSLTPVEAVSRIRRLEEFDLTWVEEPVNAHDHDGHAFISREVATPIQAGENWWGPQELTKAIEKNATDYVMPDVMKIGGVTGWMQAAATAHAHNVAVSNHLWPEISAQLLAATPTAHYLEYADWWNPILKEPLRLQNGMTEIEGVIGTGTQWDEAAIAKYGV